MPASLSQDHVPSPTLATMITLDNVDSMDTVGRGCVEDVEDLWDVNNKIVDAAAKEQQVWLASTSLSLVVQDIPMVVFLLLSSTLTSPMVLKLMSTFNSSSPSLFSFAIFYLFI
jgi:hypothetical protein